MLTYSLSDIGNEPIYLYLYRCIKDDILSGALPADTKLPSKRSFASQLGISNITVENTYAILQSEGYLYSVPKKGYYVSDLSLVSHPLRFAPNRNDADEGNSNSSFSVSALSTESSVVPVIPDELLRKFHPETNTPATYDLVSNRTSSENFPFSIWAKLMRNVISLQSEELMSALPCGGSMTLRSAICEHLTQFRGMHVRPEQVIIGAGTDYLYSLLIPLLGRDKIYGIEDPGYEKIEKVYAGNDVVCHRIPMDHAGIMIQQTDADVVHISPSHHYPTGIVTPVSRRLELLRWASEDKNRYIIEDDYDSEFRFSGKPMPTLQSIDTAEKVIYMNTFTKSLASTIRISYLVLPPHLLERYYQKLGFYASTVSTFEQFTLAAFIREGYFEKHINRMRNHYRSLRDAIQKEIEESPLGKHVQIREQESGLHFLLVVDTPFSDSELVVRAAENNLRISCLSEYYKNPADCQKNAIVVNYSGIRMQDIPNAVKCLERACLK